MFSSQKSKRSILGLLGFTLALAAAKCFAAGPQRIEGVFPPRDSLAQYVAAHDEAKGGFSGLLILREDEKGLGLQARWAEGKDTPSLEPAPARLGVSIVTTIIHLPVTVVTSSAPSSE